MILDLLAVQLTRLRFALSVSVPSLQTTNYCRLLTKKISTTTKSTLNAFGILKGKVKDPMQWQREIREESDRDIYDFIEKHKSISAISLGGCE